MIDIGKTKESVAGYAFCIEGNGGEEELLICMSPGQDGRCRMIVVAMCVDGGQEHDGVRLDLPYHRGPKDEVALALIAEVITKWATSGIAPDREQRRAIDKKVADVAKRCAKHFGYED